MTDSQLQQTALPDMPSPAVRWAIRTDGIQGIIPAASRREAELHKQLLDELDEQARMTLTGELNNAVVILWPFSRQEHADALIRLAQGV